jgi:TonB family protein
LIFVFLPVIVNSQLSRNNTENSLRKVLEETRKSLGINFIYSDNLVGDIYIPEKSEQTITLDNLQNFLSQFNLSYKKFDKDKYIIIKKKTEKTPSTRQTVLTNEKITDRDSLKLMIRPILLSKQPPQYPAEAVNKGIEGSVRIKFLVEKNGRVANSQVLATSGYDILDSTALDYVYTLRYSPGELNGKPQSTWMSMLVRYILEDKEN